MIAMEKSAKEITLIGTLPPIKGVSDYCIQQTKQLSKKTNVLFYNFKSIYPELLYPGGKTKEKDPIFRFEKNSSLEVKNILAWYNPLSWIFVGLNTKGKIVHFHWWTFFLFPVFFTIALIARFRKKKVLCTIHNVISHESGVIDKILSKLIFSLPNHFIVHTKVNKKQLNGFFKIPEEKISIIPHGIYDFYCDKKISKIEARKNLNIPINAKALLFFGNIRKYKGLDDLVIAFKEARKKIPGLFLIVAGKSWNSEAEKKLKESLGGITEKVLFLDYVSSSKIKYYFEATDIVILPYKDFAAQSGPGNIALGFKKPLIVSDTGGLPELVLNKNFVFNAGNTKQLAEKICLAFSKKSVLDSMVKNSIELRKKFSWESISTQTLKLYNELSSQ